MAKPRPESKSSLLSKSTQGATLLIALQIGSRAFTFVVGQLLLRFLFPPELLGISTQLEVFSISILFFARESLRVAIQRQTDEPEPPNASATEPNTVEKDDFTLPAGHVDGGTAGGKMQAIVNLAYVSIYIGVVIAMVLSWLYWRAVAKTPDVSSTPYFRRALELYGAAAVLELWAEPCFVVAQHRSMYKTRATAEAVATLLRCLATCASAIWASRTAHDLGVLPFAFGQVAYAISLVLVYYWGVRGVASTGGFNLKSTPISARGTSSFVLFRPLLVLGASLFVQLLVKHVLTQGDTILIATFASPVAQGTYALANNYGGLLARLILQPVEESSRNYFGKLLATVDGNPSKEVVVKARSSLLSLLRAYILLSVCVVAVGPTIAPLLLKVVAGPKWAMSGAGDVLATYCYYIPLLAINGVTEAFVSSVATKSEVNRQSVWMLAFSVGFGGSAFLFLRVLDLGAEGLVWANVMNMGFRIVWSTIFITNFLRRQGSGLDFGLLLPRGPTLAAGVATSAALVRAASTFNGGVTDFVKSGSIALIFVVMLALSERAYLLDCYQSIRGQPPKI